MPPFFTFSLFLNWQIVLMTKTASIPFQGLKVIILCALVDEKKLGKKAHSYRNASRSVECLDFCPTFSEFRLRIGVSSAIDKTFYDKLEG